MPSVEHFVDVGGEDLLLRPDARELLREARLFHLALERPLVTPDVQVPDELLRQRRAALYDLAGLRVGVERPGDALVVERAVHPEAPVLDRDGRLREPGRDLADLQRLPVALRRDDAEQAAVGGEEERVLAE